MQLDGRAVTRSPLELESSSSNSTNSNRTQCCKRLATAATFLWKELCCLGAMTRRRAPPIRYTLWRNTDNITKLWIWLEAFLAVNDTQARSQDLEKGGGLFWKSEKCANDLDSNFHWSWISFRRFVRKLRRNISESSEIQRFFPPKIRWFPKKKKKKGLRQNSEWFFGRNAKFEGFFLPKLGDLKKKKKKSSSPKFRVIFRPKCEIQRFFPPKIRWSPKTKKKVFAKIQNDFSSNFANSDVWGGLFSYGGGAFFRFSQKIGLKSTKNMRFAYFTSQWGGSSSPAPPPPPWLRYWRYLSIFMPK